MTTMFIETETTPNPASLKFLPGRQVMPSGTREFVDPESAEASPLAEALFDTGEVTNVLLGSDFIAVTAAPGVDWSQLKPQVVAVLLDHFVSGAPLFVGGGAGGISVPPEADLIVEEDPADADIVAQIRELIDEVLFLSELESGTRVVSLGAVPVRPELEAVVSELADRSSRAGVALVVEGDPAVTLAVRPRMIRVIAQNLAERLRRANRDLVTLFSALVDEIEETF